MPYIHRTPSHPSLPPPRPAVVSPPTTHTQPRRSTAAVGWNGGTGMDPAVPQLSGPRPPAPKTGFPREVNEYRAELFQQTYRQHMASNFELYRRLPPDDQAAMRAAAQQSAEGMVARFDRLYTEARTQYRRLPEEDVNELAFSTAQTRIDANDGQALEPHASYVNQRNGFVSTGTDEEGNSYNNNCGYASALATLQYLGVPLPTPGKDVPAGTSETFHRVMMLRGMGGGGNTSTLSSALDIEAALDDAGARATTITSSDAWKADHSKAVEWMKQQFLDPRNGGEAFIVGGRPGAAWPEYSDYNGSHWVSVVDYDPATNTFTVLDPYPKKGQTGEPIQVTPEQLATYLEADDDSATGIKNNEIVLVRP